MTQATTRPTSRLHGCSLLIAVVAAALFMAGCEVDSFFDPSKTGRFEHTATTIPILDRIDVIERSGSEWGDTTEPTAQDLVPSDLSYRMIPGDVVTVEIFELYSPGQWYRTQRRVDAAGNIRIAELGDIRAAGLTAQEFEDRITEQLKNFMVGEPLVDVVVAEAGAFRYTIYGYVPGPGVFTLRNPDLRLLDALALAGGASTIVDEIYIIRSVTLSEEISPEWSQGRAPGGGQQQPSGQQPDQNIEDLIKGLEEDNNNGGASPGAFAQDSGASALVDIDDLDPVQQGGDELVDVEDVAEQGQPGRPQQPTYFYDQQRGEWVRVPGTDGAPTVPSGQQQGERSDMIVERVIEIDYQSLLHGNSSLNIVVRPNDRIFVEPPVTGVVYIDGEVVRRGVYNLPSTGDLTLSRLISAAGGLNPLAIPERVDLTRRVGKNREATVRLDLAAIRNRTEPDIFIKPDDSIIIGTSWVASPLAVIRNGFRATYGFGFLLDRNFGPDVFGPTPVDRGF